MTPELVRALRANPRLQKRLRERGAALVGAVEEGRAEAVLAAAREWAETEEAVEADLAEKEAEPPRHRISFLIEETYYRDFCEVAEKYGLSPSEVARRYCESGLRFSNIILRAMRKGQLDHFIVTRPQRGLNLAEWVLPDFTRRG